MVRLAGACVMTPMMPTRAAPAVTGGSGPEE
jgi:hypothetical protein